MADHPTDALVERIELRRYNNDRTSVPDIIREWYDENVAPLVTWMACLKTGYLPSSVHFRTCIDRGFPDEDMCNPCRTRKALT